MKIKSVIKAKGVWSQFRRDLVMSAAEYAKDYYDLGGCDITVKFVGEDGENNGSMATTDQGNFWVWITPCYSTKTLLETIFHEMTHVKQFVFDGWDMGDDEDTVVCWKGKEREYDEDTDYWNAPWEVEARRMGRKLTKMYRKSS